MFFWIKYGQGIVSSSSSSSISAFIRDMTVDDRKWGEKEGNDMQQSSPG